MSCSPWAYGFDSAAQRAPEKLRLVRKKNISFPSQLDFVWPVCRAYDTGRRASVKDCKVYPLKGGGKFL